MTNERTNEERAESAAEGLRAYGAKRDHDGDLSELAGDMLVDLFHLADREGWDMRAALTAAEANFNEEKEGEA